MKLKQLYIRLIADYGAAGDLAFSEVEERLHANLQSFQAEQFESGTFMNYHIMTTPVRPLNAVENAFVTAQLAVNTPLGENYLVYNNVAPRKDNLAERKENAGEPFIYLRLKNGAQVVIVNSSVSATLLKPHAEEIRHVHVDNDKTQFRSRDNYPRILGHIARGDYSCLGDDASADVPDEFPENVVVYNDGYGNLKTSIKVSTVEAVKGQRLTVEINGRKQVVAAADGIFSVKDGEFCIAKGSSGWPMPNGERLDFVEIVKRGNSAYAEFAKPPAGLSIDLRNEE
ncbi:MAG: hypothetical protein CL565_02745 [Alphaproteobacteria bacterium]|nr:hypothetical protein [Alphaproteobacteria bacterium]|tara:strand:- start:578 stop:1432 length:855 start_codon:yes stop_codon:yes gene_type:complete